MRHATELKTSQPVFPGQPPPLARVETSKQQNYSPQPPPRQSSQPPQRSANINRTAFPGQQPPNVAVSSPSTNSFREPSFSAAAVAQQQVNTSYLAAFLQTS